MVDFNTATSIDCTIQTTETQIEQNDRMPVDALKLKMQIIQTQTDAFEMAFIRIFPLVELH